MKRIVIVGATSGIGLEVARLCIRAGWRVGAAGRHKEALEALRSEAPGQVETETIDITRDDAPERLARLVERLGGMEIYFHASGIGSRNTALRPDIELNTLRTNGEGFVRMVTAAFGHFRTEKVAARIMHVLRHPRRRVVIDRRYALMVFFWKLIPEWLWERLNIRKDD